MTDYQQSGAVTGIRIHQTHEAAMGAKFTVDRKKFEVTFICGEGDNGLVEITEITHPFRYRFRVPWQFVAEMRRTEITQETVACDECNGTGRHKKGCIDCVRGVYTDPAGNSSPCVSCEP